VKPRAADIEALVRNLDPAYRTVLVYGPNEGLVRERADTIAAQIVDDLSDPFNVANLTMAEIADDPGRIAIEAASISMLGGRRVIRIDAATDAITAALESFLNDPKGDGLVIVTSGDLSPRSSLRKLAEAARNAVSIPCYADDARSLGELIHRTLGEHGLDVEPDAVVYLQDRLGEDRGIIRGELDKLAIYKAGDRHPVVTLGDARACVGDSGALTLDEVSSAVTGGELARLDRALTRAFSQGETPVAVLRAVGRRLMRLYEAAGHVAEGVSPDDAMRRLRPPVFFKEIPAFRRQLGRWSAPRLAAALELVAEAEVNCKTTGMPDTAVCARACLRIARAAQPRR